MPTPRTSFEIAVYKNKIYCIGGYIGNGSVTAVNEVYDPATDTWETKEPMPTARSLPGTNMVAGKIYLVEGRVGTYAYQSTLANEVYYPDSWSTKTSASLRINSLGSAVFNNKIYFIATRSTRENPAQGGLTLTYDPFADKWSIGKTSPTYGSACAIGVTSGANDSKGIYFFAESVTYKYDPETENWTNYTSMPTARGYAGVAVFNDEFYVIGGIFAPYEGYIVMTDSATTNEQYVLIGYGTPNQSPSLTPAPSPEPKQAESFQTTLFVASVLPMAVIGVGLLICFKKRKH
jgi:N-acetylneuraminic acid mutarotase